MAKGVQIQIKGLKQLQDKFKKLAPDIHSAVDAQMGVAAMDFVSRAVNDAPTDQGVLRNEITFSRTGDLHYEVVSGANYSAYVEFGTRTRVQVPTDLVSYAAGFKGQGTSKAAKEMIYEWCRRKGIEERFWWPIFINIMTRGVYPHPYFFKQRQPVYEEMMKKLRAQIKSILKK